MMTEDEFDRAIQALSLHAEMESTYLFAYALFVGRRIYYETTDPIWLDILWWQNLKTTGLINSGTVALVWLEHVNDYRAS